MCPSRFLVVDDDQFSAHAVSRSLRRFGESRTACNAEEAERLLQGEPAWTAFFIDVVMPGLSGIDLLRRLRPRYPRVPTLLVSGYVEAEFVGAAFDLGADYLVKPLSAERLALFLSNRVLNPARSADGKDLDERVDRLLQTWHARYRLSKAELDLLRRAARGESRVMMAVGRRCSEATIQRHVSDILRRTGDDSFHAIVVRLLRQAALS